jgi:peptidyl-prolyl cis-trans isomerase SurA
MLMFCALAPAALPGMDIVAAQANEIKVVVNNVPITSYDIDRRAAFLRLQHKGGGREQATKDMVDQTLRLQEMKRLNIEISDAEVDKAYASFASSNHISTAQLDAALAQGGVTSQHFKQYIRAQIGWSRALQARYRATDAMTEQEAVQKMLQQGGKKPTAKEYMLQQVIFVIPDGEKSALLAKRKREAEAMRKRFQNCNTTRNFAKGLLDVTVRDLGRVLAPELPPDWKKQITETSAGEATPIRVTNRGVEFIGVCSSREVSDHRVAQMVFQAQEPQDNTAKELTEKYMKELRGRATIVKR